MATSIPDSTIEEIKARTDLGELIASYGVQLRHTGSSLTACCPFHREKTPSFHINVSRGFYHCFGCGESGDAIKFVQKQEGMTFIEAVKKLAARCGIEIKEKEDPNAGRRKRLYALMAELAQFYRRCLVRMKAAQGARDYLVKRDLDEATQEAFLIGYAPDGSAPMLTWAEKHGYTPQEMEAAGVLKMKNEELRMKNNAAGGGHDSHSSFIIHNSSFDCYHRFGGRLMFAVRDRQGRVVAFSGRQLVERKNSGKYVNSPETDIFKKSNVLYGFDKAAGNIAKSPHREVIVCEGQIDCIRLHISGFPVAVASQGTAFTEEHVRMLSRVADAAALVFDDDAAGHKAAIRSAGMLLAAGMPVRVVRLPDGDDPDSFLRTKGAEAFQRLLDAAESVVSFQCRVERAKEAKPDSLDAVSRVTKAVLGTIAQCPNAVLRASMVGEAAKLLGLPSAALSEELEKVKGEGVRVKGEGVRTKGEGRRVADEEDDASRSEATADDSSLDGEAVLEGDDIAATLPPSKREMALMSFLVANEGDGNVAEAVGACLPDAVFAHDFTRRFVAAWRHGEDGLNDFASALEGDERAWFDRTLLDAGKVQACGLGPGDILQDFVRNLWLDHLRALRGDIDARAEDDATLARRIRLTEAMKRLGRADWEEVGRMIEDFRKGEN